jgi:hypothetical protein
VNEVFENSALSAMADELEPPIAAGGFVCHLPEAVLHQLFVQKPTTNTTTFSACTLQ